MNYFEFFEFRQKLVRDHVLVARETRRDRRGTTAGWKFHILIQHPEGMKILTEK
jgi:hypothetical protein